MHDYELNTLLRIYKKQSTESPTYPMSHSLCDNR